jgi:hypothetical protein
MAAVNRQFEQLCAGRCELRNILPICLDCRIDDRQNLLPRRWQRDQRRSDIPDQPARQRGDLVTGQMELAIGNDDNQSRVVAQARLQIISGSSRPPIAATDGRPMSKACVSGGSMPP